MKQQSLHILESRVRRRRAHFKSRNGCSECKARHMKCDEGRPRCVNCATTDRRCCFPPHRSTTSSAAHLSKAEDNESDSRIPRSGAYFTAVHLTCLHHAEVYMNEYLALHGMAQPIIDIAINNAIPAPYLLDQVLALSALHLSTQDPSKELLYHHQATELQTRALELFNKEKEDVSEVNYIPVFLFASFLGVHVLRETLSSHPDNLSAFVDGFVRYAHLHRGVRTVIERASWTHILQSELKHIMSPWGTSNENEEHTSGKETLTLSNYLDSYNAGHGSIDACQSALKDMQWVFDRSNSDHADKNLGIHAVIAWPLLISQEYIDILNQHRPEAFAVLALYATCLHRYREFWVFGGAGSHLLHLILSSIGSFWRGKLGLSVEVLSKA